MGCYMIFGDFKLTQLCGHLGLDDFQGELVTKSASDWIIQNSRVHETVTNYSPLHMKFHFLMRLFCQIVFPKCKYHALVQAWEIECYELVDQQQQ